MRGVRSAVFGTSSASAVITMATHCQCMWRQRGAGRGPFAAFARSSTFLCEVDRAAGMCFISQSLKCFTLFPGAGESTIGLIT